MRKRTLCNVVLALLVVVLSFGCDLLGLGKPSLKGTWGGYVAMDFGAGTEYGKFELTFEDTTYSALMIDQITNETLNGSSRGTYTFSGAFLETTRTERYDGAQWVTDTTQNPTAFVILTDDVLSYAFSFSTDSEIEYVWTLFRQ